MARLGAMATSLLPIVLACVALAALVDGRQTLVADSGSADRLLSAPRMLLSKNLKDSKSAPDCSTDSSGPACNDDHDEAGHAHGQAGESGDAHHEGDGDGDHAEDKEGDHDEGEQGHEHEEGEEGHEHEEGEEGHEHEEGEGHHEEGEWGFGAEGEEHDHEEHDHGHGGNFVELLGAEPATSHTFGLVGIAEGGNMTRAHIVTLLDALERWVCMFWQREAG
ncbi:unnamed protein product [Ostreobium quekettii]|uniref:Uncharacterized protein n=1 Tax=Ostreobium quekettii TaxID=121088 RepID=A0A8S1JCV9_9CHLO|nr:unnamed protein product [Ostreobium quekettii]